MNIRNVERNIVAASGLLKCLSHKGRLQVLCALSEREMNVGSLEKITGLSQSALSQHLALLRKKKIVKTRREAQTIYYSLNDPDVHTVLDCLGSLYKEQVEVLA